MSIFIFSQPIRSGKTTMLMCWCNQQENVYGILMPDIQGRRMMFDIAAKNMFPAQCMDSHTDQALVTIGKYTFFDDAFKKANVILLEALQLKPKWLVIDEIGNLEMDGKGFYNSAKPIIEDYQSNDKNLLLTVRDSLISKVVSFFNISHYVHLNELDKWVQSERQ